MFDTSNVPLAADSVTDFFVLAADANHDRIVNTLDFNVLAANFGTSGKSFSQGDFNYSHSVDSSDFSLLASQFGKYLAPIASSTTSQASKRIDLGSRDVGLLDETF